MAKNPPNAEKLDERNSAKRSRNVRVGMIVDALIFYFLALRSGYGEDDVQDILREEGVPMPEPSLVTGKK